MTFKEGDTIRMKEDCGMIKKGEVLSVKDDGYFLCVESQGELCSCTSIWELVPEPKTLETLEVGDMVMNKKGQTREILAVLQRRGEKTVYALSAFSNFKTCVNYLFTAYELKLTGYTIASQPTEVTMTPSEIEEKLGMEKGTLKIKE